MRLTFNKSDYMNTGIFDEEGRLLYSVDTPFAWKNQKTTITKHYESEEKPQPPEVLAVFEWSWLKKPVVHFKEQTMKADDLLVQRRWRSTDRYFKGPDGRTYRWKIRANCRLQPEDSDTELVKYHRQNVGIMKPPHSPYLEISSTMTHMLDEIVTTLIYAEKLSTDEDTAAATAGA